ncbi:MAG: efflux RND transporter periplasmic adaptor subunit [Kofleriaceae bacterium]|jgi:cobalt-zinc-cadmium efflux system membrane fusion protein|nr:efflux RND transporter periplasmic adaptor subunit [Kofleriaceae bacterium]MBP6835927.1 efflux RND transporter periplasmic adaptor subunit [Kofleriaceae bacterium]MBP9203022.1 efflux RND transporter periplasmic adaptor subunit [Kofleriaceae bacterium]
MTTPALTRLAMLTALAACHGHDHAPPGAADDHGHGAAGPAELPGQSVTIWAERTELFMEYPPLIVGQPTRFAAHVTEMPSFRAVTAGAASVTVKLAGGAEVVGRADAPANPGIFRPTVTPSAAGACELIISVESPQVTERFSAGPCQVYASEADARAALGEEGEDPPGRIVYLKEQQWKTDFALALVAPRDLQDGVRASGEIRAVAGREARVSAPFAGRVELVSPAPLLGVPVKQGALLATIAPRASAGVDRATLAADASAAQAEVQAARAELARAERLVAEQAAPARTVDEARTRLQIAQARQAGAGGRLGQYDSSAAGGGGGRRFQLRAPIDGTLVALDVATGETVEEGRPLLGVIDLDRVWLVAQVFEPDLPKAEGARAAWFTVEGYPDPFVADERNSRLVTVGRVIDPRTRTAPVIFELDNRDGRLRIGNFAKVLLATEAPRRVLAVPEAAIVDDAGQAVAYVMVEGEAFERRPLRLGVRAHGWAEVREGVVEGERVVTTGAYEVRLAAASGAVPAHGHAH